MYFHYFNENIDFHNLFPARRPSGGRQAGGRGGKNISLINCLIKDNENTWKIYGNMCHIISGYGAPQGGARMGK